VKAKAFVGQVVQVEPHPSIENLDVVSMTGVKIFGIPWIPRNIANREPPDPEGDGSTEPRYEVGDYAVMLTENMILPDWLLKHLDMWDHEKNKGTCGGSKGNRLRTRKIPNNETGIVSDVALLPVYWTRKTDEMHNGRVTQQGLLHFATAIEPDSTDLLISAITVSKVINPDDGSDDGDITPVGFDVASNIGIEEIYVPQ
jgi:hypothetical protein